MTAAPLAWQALSVAPAAGFALLDQASDQSDPWLCWARGALLLAVGELRQAFAELQDVAARDGEVAGLAAAKVASGLRQLDEHDAAVGWDQLAVAAGGAALVDGLVGLAADAVGRGAAREAADQLAGVVPFAAGWRDQVRVAWVETEVALLDGRDAAIPARRAFDLSVARQSPRHVVKSRLFLAAAIGGTRPVEAVELARPGLADALALGLAPFVWPFVSVLGADATTAERAAAAEAVRFLATRLPPRHGGAWLRRMSAPG